MAIGWLDNACMHVNNERYYSLREENGPETSVYPEDAMMSLRVAIVAYCKTQLHNCSAADAYCKSHLTSHAQTVELWHLS